MEQIDFTTVKYLIEISAYSMSEELELLQVLSKKYSLKEVGLAASESGVSRQTIYNRINDNQIMYTKISQTIFVI